MTLAELKTAIQDYCMSSETTFVNSLNTIISNAEKRVYNKVMVPDAKTSTTWSSTSGTNSYSRTIDMVIPLRMWLTVSSVDRVPMLRKSASYIREAFVGSTNDEPTHYSWLKSSPTQATFLFGPTPDSSSYTINLEYIDGTPPSLVSAETWLSTNYPDVLRKVSLHEASIFSKQFDKEQQDVLKQDAEESIQLLVKMVGAPPRDESNA